MTFSQPQQQAQYRPNRTALWVNDRKNAANQPDYKGNLELSYALVQELLAAFNAGQYTQDRGGQPCIKLDIALYAQQVTPGDKKPILSGQLSTLGETQHSAAARQQAAQQYQQAQAPQQPQPQPQQQPQPAPAQPQPMQSHPEPLPPDGWPAHIPWTASAWGGAPPQQPIAPPAPVQQGTQPGPWGQPGPEVAAAIMAAYAHHERAQSMAPPAPVQPMPGAIHGQPPAGPPQPQYAPTGLAPVLPQGF